MTAFVSAGVFLVVLVVLLFLLLKGHRNNTKNTAYDDPGKADASGAAAVCPLCGSTLLKGENLTARCYRPLNVSDQLCTINGCPHCYPVTESNLKRECPVCHKAVDVKDGFLVARLFNKPDGKRHVVVTGCSSCSKSAKYL